MRELRELADSSGLMLIEDAAHAHGAREGDLRAGALGDACAFSFYPTKLLGAMGDAGALTTRDEALAARARLLRSYGQGSPPGDAATAGLSSRLDELQAAVLRVRLRSLDGRWSGCAGSAPATASCSGGALAGASRAPAERRGAGVAPVHRHARGQGPPALRAGRPRRRHRRPLLAAPIRADGVRRGRRFPRAERLLAEDPQPAVRRVADRRPGLRGLLGGRREREGHRRALVNVVGRVVRDRRPAPGSRRPDSSARSSYQTPEGTCRQRPSASSKGGAAAVVLGDLDRARDHGEPSLLAPVGMPCPARPAGCREGRKRARGRTAATRGRRA